MSKFLQVRFVLSYQNLNSILKTTPKIFSSIIVLSILYFAILSYAISIFEIISLAKPLQIYVEGYNSCTLWSVT